MNIEMVAFPAVGYVKEKAQFLSVDELTPGDTVLEISGTELRARLEKQLDIPDWFSFPDIINILQQSYPSKHKQGVTLFFTGLSGAGKSTLAKAVLAKLLESNQRKVTLLDGDIIRKSLSSELGYSKADRDTHIKRMGYVAAEITKHQGIVICAAIAPYLSTRKLIRNMISSQGGFIEIYLSTSVDVCKARDIKGLYKKAELGLIKEFTGVSDPYEAPVDPEIVIDTSKITVEEAVDLIFTTIQKLGYWRLTAISSSTEQG